MKPVIIIAIGVIVVGIGVVFLFGSPPENVPSKIIPEQIPEGLTLEQYDKSDSFKELENKPASTLFRVYSYQKDIVEKNNGKISLDAQFELKPDLMELYQKIGFFSSSEQAIVIIPIFTSSAYYSPGFYDYYNENCDVSCLTTKIEFDKPIHYYMASQNAVKILELLNYDVVTDVDVDKDSNLLKKYDKVILLHNEYVTQKEFDAITNHPNVIYLYPNSLYGKISVNYDTDTISLIRGHGYPDKSISNGFDWEFDNTHPFEFDNKCIDWEFYKIDNGIMLNCYPEFQIVHDDILLKFIKDY